MIVKCQCIGVLQPKQNCHPVCCVPSGGVAFSFWHFACIQFQKFEVRIVDVGLVVDFVELRKAKD